MENRVIAIMSNVFDMDASEINENASPDNIDKWDSLKHINLIVALEEEFGIEFDNDEIADMLNYKLIVEIVKNKSN